MMSFICFSDPSQYRVVINKLQLVGDEHEEWLPIVRIISVCMVVINLLHIWHTFLFSADFFSKLTSSKILSGTLSEFQTVWIQIRTDILSVLILF